MDSVYFKAPVSNFGLKIIKFYFIVIIIKNINLIGSTIEQSSRTGIRKYLFYPDQKENKSKKKRFNKHQLPACATGKKYKTWLKKQAEIQENNREVKLMKEKIKQNQSLVKKEIDDIKPKKKQTNCKNSRSAAKNTKK